jgi:transcriptional regulator with XRE-family HTH domain
MSKMSLFPEFSNAMTAETLGVVMDDLGLTGVALAERLDVDPKTVSRWLRNEVPIPGSVALLMRVAHEMQKFSHVWNGHGMAAQDVPSKRVRWTRSTGARP